MRFILLYFLSFSRIHSFVVGNEDAAKGNKREIRSLGSRWNREAADEDELIDLKERKKRGKKIKEN